MNKIVQLIQHPYIGGLEKMAFSLCSNEIADSKMYLVALEGTKKHAIKHWSELSQLEDFYCLNKQSGVSFRVVKKLVEIIDHHKINAIHSHHIGPMLYGALVKLMRPSVKHIHTIHDAWYLTDFKYRMFTKTISSMTPITLVADAKAVAQVAKEKAQIKSDYVVLNGIDTDYFSPSSRYLSRQKLNLPNNVALIGCAARLEQGKGHEAMLRSLVDLPYKIHMAFAGSGNRLAYLKAYAMELGVTERVHWLGCVSEMPAFYSAIDVFCLFSEREGLPLSLLEAMACNRPVVASDVGGVKEVVNNKMGFILPVNDESKLATTFCKALNFNYGMDIRHYAVAKGNIKVMANRYNKIYQHVIV